MFKAWLNVPISMPITNVDVSNGPAAIEVAYPKR
jgi:hypothetical protein